MTCGRRPVPPRMAARGRVRLALGRAHRLAAPGVGSCERELCPPPCRRLRRPQVARKARRFVGLLARPAHGGANGAERTITPLRDVARIPDPGVRRWRAGDRIASSKYHRSSRRLRTVVASAKRREAISDMALQSIRSKNTESGEGAAADRTPGRSWGSSIFPTSTMHSAIC